MLLPAGYVRTLQGCVVNHQERVKYLTDTVLHLELSEDSSSPPSKERPCTGESSSELESLAHLGRTGAPKYWTRRCPCQRSPHLDVEHSSRTDQIFTLSASAGLKQLPEVLLGWRRHRPPAQGAPNPHVSCSHKAACESTHWCLRQGRTQLQAKQCTMLYFVWTQFSFSLLQREAALRWSVGVLTSRRNGFGQRITPSGGRRRRACRRNGKQHRPAQRSWQGLAAS